MYQILFIIIFCNASIFCISNQRYNETRQDRQTHEIVDPSMIVVGYTVQPTLDKSAQSLRKYRASTHYIIDTNGDIYEDLHEHPKKIISIDHNECKKRAWHAGHSYWKTHKQKIYDVNSHSIGILFVNEGATPKDKPEVLTTPTDQTNITTWYNFTEPQIQAFAYLVQQLKNLYTIDDKDIVGHGEVAINPETKSVGRKVAPGPKFPWKKIAQEYKIGFTDNLSEEELNKPCSITPQTLQELLQRWGYSIAITNQADEQTKQAVLEFQIHHDQQAIDGDCNSCRVYYKLLNLINQHTAKKTNIHKDL